MALKVDIFTRNMELTDKLSEYVNKKVVKLDRFLSGVDEARVDLEFEKSARSSADRQIAQVTLRGRGFILRSEERADDLFTAIDNAIDKIQRRAERVKSKRQRGRGDGASAADVAPEPVAVEPVEDERPVISRRKEFELVPMDEGEALEQMVLLGHDNFFIFFNANTNNVNVLYRRRDGTYGMIEPRVG